MESQISNSICELESNISQLIKLSYNLIKTRHPLLGLQTRSVVELCQLVKDTGFYTEQEYKTLEISAWLQNIGFIGISSDLLSRYMDGGEDLTEDEWHQIRTTPEKAEALVEGLEGDLSHIARVLRTQCERWDGKGYPDGQAQENLPNEMRYLSVVSHYVRSTKSKEETIQEIIEETGKAFYPEAVRLFLKVTEAVKLPEKVKELLFEELEEGMVLAYPVHTPVGLLLYPEDKEIDGEVLEKLRDYNNVEPIWDRILVYRD